MGTTISGATGIDKVQDGTIVNADINSSAAIAGSKLVMPAGSTIQTQATNYQGAYSTTSASWVDVANFSADITPSSTSNKVLVQVMMQICTTDWGGINIVRKVSGESDVILNQGNDTVGSKLNSSFGSIAIDNYIDTQLTMPFNFIYLDSPATTSEVTYQVQVVGRYGAGGQTFYINRPTSWNDDSISGRVTASNIVVQEIAG
jgi:hypothetical protein